MMKKLIALKAKHRSLELALRSLVSRPHVNEYEIQELKKQKLQIKEAIHRTNKEAQTAY